MDLVKVFTGFQSIYGLCPCCGEVFRLSEAALFVTTPPPETAFDELDDEISRQTDATSRFESEEERIRANARKAGQGAARSRLAAIAPEFVSRKIDPNDVKVLFDPVLYLAFKGMTKGSCSELLFIDKPAKTTARRRLHSSLVAAFQAGNVEWRTLRVGEDGSIKYS